MTFSQKTGHDWFGWTQFLHKYKLVEAKIMVWGLDKFLELRNASDYMCSDCIWNYILSALVMTWVGESMTKMGSYRPISAHHYLPCYNVLNSDVTMPLAAQLIYHQYLLFVLNICWRNAAWESRGPRLTSMTTETQHLDRRMDLERAVFCTLPLIIKFSA